MKKTFCKWGAVAAIIAALALIFAACPQSTEEESSGSGHQTTLRLWYNTDDALQIKSGDKFVITLFKKNADTKTLTKTGNTLEDALRGDVYTNSAQTKFNEVLNTIVQPIESQHLTRTSKGNYLDLLIVDNTPLATGSGANQNKKNEIWQGSGSYYLALSVAEPTITNTPGLAKGLTNSVIPGIVGDGSTIKDGGSISGYGPGTGAFGSSANLSPKGNAGKVPASGYFKGGEDGFGYFIYCPDKLDRNEQNKIAATPKQFNVNVKTVSITNGINDIYLRNFINF